MEPKPESLKSKTNERPKTLVGTFGMKEYPYDMDGTVSVDNASKMTHFVAKNLEHKIRLSSPVTRTSFSASEDDLDSNGKESRHNPNQSQSTDLNVLNDLEIEAQYMAYSVDNLTENLCNLLHSVSSITADNEDIYKRAVNKLTDCMDANIKSMYTIMAKTEEITNALKPIDQLAVRIRDLKRLVDLFDNNL